MANLDNDDIVAAILAATGRSNVPVQEAVERFFSIRSELDRQRSRREAAQQQEQQQHPGPGRQPDDKDDPHGG